VRNFQARNLLREMAPGDGVIFYHSSADPPAAAGTAQIAGTARPDPTQFDRKSDHYDPDSKPEDPRWYGVDIRLDRKFARPVTLPELRARPDLEDMVLLRKGSRLSVQPVTTAEWRIICKLGFEG
jgi:predicted RNA-binding protein with PUA-like domain